MKAKILEHRRGEVAPRAFTLIELLVVIAVQAAQHAAGVTAAQLAAVENAKQAVKPDLVARPDRGDAKAKAQFAAIERTRSQ